MDFIIHGHEPFIYFMLDNVKIRKGNITWFDYEDSYEYHYNTDIFESKELFFTTPHCDHLGNVIPEGSYMLPPLKAILLTNCFCNYDGICNNNENANTCPVECDPICGNGICEYETQNIFNCPSDCVDFVALGISISVIVVCCLCVKKC